MNLTQRIYYRTLVFVGSLLLSIRAMAREIDILVTPTQDLRDTMWGTTGATISTIIIAIGAIAFRKGWGSGLGVLATVTMALILYWSAPWFFETFVRSWAKS